MQRTENASLQRQVKELGDLVTKLHGEVMGMRNAPSAIATTIPGQADPFQQIAMQQPGVEDRGNPTSSLGAFAEVRESERRRPGRPRKNPIEDEAA
jgi:hypothetical protein